MVDKKPLAKKLVLKRLMRENTNYRNRMDKRLLLMNQSTRIDKKEDRNVLCNDSRRVERLY